MPRQILPGREVAPKGLLHCPVQQSSPPACQAEYWNTTQSPRTQHAWRQAAALELPAGPELATVVLNKGQALRDGGAPPAGRKRFKWRSQMARHLVRVLPHCPWRPRWWQLPLAVQLRC